MNRRNLLAGIVALPLLPKKILADIFQSKSRKRIFATGYNTYADEETVNHEAAFGFFVADDESLKTGREILIISKKVKNEHFKDKKGYGYYNFEGATSSRLGFDFFRRIYTWYRDNRKKSGYGLHGLHTFRYEREDSNIVWKELPKCLDEISSMFKNTKKSAMFPGRTDGKEIKY